VGYTPFEQLEGEKIEGVAVIEFHHLNSPNLVRQPCVSRDTPSPHGGRQVYRRHRPRRLIAAA